jgi:hypothetical protein
MTTITLEAIKVEHGKVLAMIAAYEAHAPRIVSISQPNVELHQGEHYAGIILGADGAPAHHLVLMPGDADGVTWEGAKEFATKSGGELPTRREQALLFANLKDQFEERYYWSSEQHAANADYAWCQYFFGGYQNTSFKSASLRARAVRRLIIS